MHPCAVAAILDGTMKVAVIIPCYKVKQHILDVIQRIGPEVHSIYVVDDCCPEGSGRFVEENCRDNRLKIVYQEANSGVGGAVVAGYRKAFEDGCDIGVKIDGDGQMDPHLIPRFIEPILKGRADYVKGNRFFSLDFLNQMPAIRVFGNTVLSFVNKAASGYWNLMDPTNGYTAIHLALLKLLPIQKVAKRYFFESDLLFRLNTIRAVVSEVPMEAHYSNEVSNLRINKVLCEFPFRYLLCFIKRLFYNYFLRNFNACSVEIVFGVALLTCGLFYGGYHWYLGSVLNQVSASGTVMVAALPVIIGFQLLLAAINFDTMNIPNEPVFPHLISRH